MFHVKHSRFDVLVVGAGHAGCEAALAADRLGARVALVTLRVDRIAQMSCNPAIGGVGKGHLVREIDALGGAMGQVADATGIQFRRLNLSRGPAVQSTRCQSDALRYREAMRERVEASSVQILEEEVADLVVDRRSIHGVRTATGAEISAGSVIITTGTFLNGLCHVGERTFAGGRVDDAPANRLSAALTGQGIELRRFKTGTTPRLAADSICWPELEAQPGDEPRPTFGFEPTANRLAQVDCHLTYTNPSTHALIREGLPRSPLFTGVIQGLGPRYCPSIEDKVVRFAEKSRHQIFLEPESLSSDWVYPNGLSTSLPEDVQTKFLRTMKGLEKVRVVQPGYAVEYDYAPPTQLLPQLMTKAVAGLFLAGQINGTSGYEEAAAQGLMAGINATRYVGGQAPVRLGRDQGYIGVLIDDLVIKGVDEPYRIFTSRAEHRLVLRESNAEDRLCDLGRQWNSLPETRYARALQRREERARLRSWLNHQKVDRPWLARLRSSAGSGSDPSSGPGPDLAGASAAHLLRRPEVSLSALLATALPGAPPFSAATRVQVEEAVKYEGYIAREEKEIAKLRDLEGEPFPADFDFDAAPSLSAEVREKLKTVRPQTLGQASRIPGITPAALAVLRVYGRRTSGPGFPAGDGHLVFGPGR